MLPLTKRVPASGFAVCGLAILSHEGRGEGDALSPIPPLPLWERIQNRDLSAAKSQILLVRGSGIPRHRLPYRFGRSKSATTSTWLDHRNWSIGVTEVSL